ncbi:Hypothetical protein MVR_LOCUS170 [uncultured virus]|nr:Hypothetical protein MVR_LOCUS170 [uncultured virus]
MTLSGLENCTQLKELNCEDNYLAVLDPLVYLRRLERLQYSGNPLNIQTVQVQRFLNRFNRAYYRPNIFSVYTNRQSVHDEHIQKTVCDSVQNLLKDPKPTFSIETLINTGLDERTLRLLFEYCGDETVHSHHLLTYCELLGYVWARISRSEHRSELIKILGEQILDAECMCFTGRFNRTLSVMVGFYPDIIIEISDNSRIGAIIMTTNSKIKPYDPVLHRALAHKLLTEAGYDEDTIDPWLGAISEL